MSAEPPSKETLDLLDSVSQLSEGLKNGKDGAREGLLDVCTKLIANIAHPSEQLLRLYWAQPTHLAIIRLGVDCKLFDALKNVSPTEGASTVDIASKCSGNPDPELIARMLRHLAAMGSVREVGPSTFAPTALTNAFTETSYEDTIVFLGDFFQNVHQATPTYFKERGFKSPSSGVDGPFQYTFDCKGAHLFEYFDKSAPQQGKRFASMMDLWSQGRPRWFDTKYYPVQERLITGATQDTEAFLVDVGGGTGHDVDDFKKAFPTEIPGELVLQDRPEILELAQVDSSIKKQPHDFLTEQPVKGTCGFVVQSPVPLHAFSSPVI